jgi:uncharacterized protein YdhG (YjbR/CyaY superfamily)
MDQAVTDYIAAIPTGHRPLFDRMDRLVREVCPDVELTLSYKMPTYTFGRRRLHVGAWAHGVSIYGWKGSGDGGLTTHHPELRTSTGTIQLRPEVAAGITDDELRALVRQVLVA